jgi:hypothetical protein
MYKYILISVFLVGCAQSPKDMVASKCRLKIPVQKEQCEAAGVYGTKGGQLHGLPVTKGEI